jgi:hypothetical protein
MAGPRTLARQINPGRRPLVRHFVTRREDLQALHVSVSFDMRVS